MPFKPDAGSDRRNNLRNIAKETLGVIESGSYTLPDSGVTHDLSAKIDALKAGTRYYAADSFLSSWSSSPLPYATPTATEFSILEISTMDGARLLINTLARSNLTDKIGILNFASAKNPGGGFINGAQAQEESLARSSTLYPSLMTNIGQQFYTSHRRDPKGGYYSHAMIYSPNVVFFRDDDGGWTGPIEADVLVSAAVNAGVVRNSLHWRVAGKSEEDRIEAAMKERMARTLYLFSKQGVKNVVLGSFGTGVFRNDVDTVAKLWADLLAVEDARFRGSFDRVMFAILGTKTFETFKKTFEERAKEPRDS